MSIEFKIHQKMPLDPIIIKRLETSYLVKKTRKVNKQKVRCKKFEIHIGCLYELNEILRGW